VLVAVLSGVDIWAVGFEYLRNVGEQDGPDFVIVFSALAGEGQRSLARPFRPFSA
jgi:hypothetical protein